ncbi:MAG: TetR/AcrR family transcriptional regulator [Candidatus Dormibacter sp.]|uniref:TetR/AcrR family transcriptional regulator n=1 Tax=Candidatus Dormibacter sp. TaxID=2973982 RepID=UPI000DB21706|nr:MAG: TetR family transcriptional regulator [Candidatus Dormibacteraeota bacterium]
MSQSTKERIAAAAVSVIRDRGVTNATTKEIAREAGVSEGSLYNHFENKTALFGAAFGLVASGIRAAMQDLFAAVGQATVEANLTRFASAAIRFYGELLPMMGSVLADPEVLGWLQHSGRAEGLSQGQAALVRYLEAEQLAGRLAPDAQPPFLAAVLLGACQHRAFASLLIGTAHQERPPGLDVDIDAYTQGIVRTLLTAQIP